MDYIYDCIIKADVGTAVDALVNPEKTSQYYYGFAIQGDWRVGGRYSYTQGDAVCIEGEITEFVPGKKIAMTFKGLWNPEVSQDPESLVTYQLWQEGANTFLRMTHSGMPEGSYSLSALPKGWVNILSGMKTLIETGAPLEVDMGATMQNR